MDPIKNRIDTLREELNRHNHNYYVLNSPQISDKDFDMLMKELELLERNFPQYDDPLSPTHRVGSDLTKGFEQVAQKPLQFKAVAAPMMGDDFIEKILGLKRNRPSVQNIQILIRNGGDVAVLNFLQKIMKTESGKRILTSIFAL